MKTDFAREIPDPWRNLSKVFTALGDEQRQRILLSFDSNETLNVTQIAQGSTLSRPTVSHHLKILREAGVLVSQKSGKEIHYRINKAFLQQSLQTVLDYLESAH